jgi:Phage Terminase
MLRDYFSGCVETLILIPKKNGKALALDTPIPTPDGWTTMGALAVGDTIFSEDGQPCRVTFATDTMHGHDCFRVAFSDGTSIVADADHLWQTSCLDRGVGVRTTREIATHLVRRSDGARRHSIPVAGALSTPEAALPIDPYVLGAWLGDGHTDAGRMTFGESFVQAEIAAAGWELSPDHCRNSSRAESRTIYGLQTQLRSIGVLGTKHIPATYLRASTAQRMSLLQGLMDTDGSISRAGQAEFVTVKEPLRDNMLELLRSLGFKPSLKTDRARLDGRDCGPRYRIQFWAFDGQPVFRMPRKLARQKAAPSRQARSTTRQIVAVDPVESVPVRCIQVDAPSRLFLAGDGMVPTHNTTLLAALALYHLLTTVDAECVIAASSRDQAQILLKQARKFVRHSGLAEFMRVKQREIVSMRDDGVVRVLASDSDTADGVIPTLAIVDELHRHKDDGAMYGVFADGLGPRNGQIITISTAGDDEEQALGRMRRRFRQFPHIERDGAYWYARSEDGEQVMHEWALDPDQDRTNLAVVKLANPAPWQTEKLLGTRFNSTSMTPWRWARFACGVWLRGEGKWMDDPRGWYEARPRFFLPAAGAQITLGWDPAWTFDSCAVVAFHATAGLGEGEDEEARRRRAGVMWPVAIFRPQEEDGGTVPSWKVGEAIRKATATWQVTAVGFDRNRGMQRLAEELSDEGIPVTVVPMGSDIWAPLTADLLSAIRRRGIASPDPDDFDDPDLARLFTSHVLNGEVKDSPHGERLHGRTRDRSKVDGLSAGGMAWWLAFEGQPAETNESPYEHKDLLILS